jgi:hypothetical protein
LALLFLSPAARLLSMLKGISVLEQREPYLWESVQVLMYLGVSGEVRHVQHVGESGNHLHLVQHLHGGRAGG